MYKEDNATLHYDYLVISYYRENESLGLGESGV